MHTYDVIVIGAGIVGTNIARELARYHLDILLLEKEYDVSMGATKANSAIVHGGYAEKHTTLKGRLCYPGRRQFRRLNEELNFGFAETGSLVVTVDDDRAPLEALLANGVQNGLDDLEIVDGQRVRELEPELSADIKWALYCRGAGVCSPYEMAIAMAENAVHNGVDLRLEHEVQRMEPNHKGTDDRGFLVHTNQGSFRGRYVVNAAGVFADHVAGMLGPPGFEIRPRSGEYLIFARDSGRAIHTVVFQLPTKLGKGVLLASTYHGNLLIGPDASDNSPRDDTSTHIERIAKIYEQTKALYDAIDPKKFLRSFTGIRARSSTDDFIIEPLAAVPEFIQVAGIQSPGLTASPVIAQRVLELLRNAGCVMRENSGFDPWRAPIITKKELLPFPEVKHLIDMPSAPEKIICRCEQVRESEIVDALHRGIPVKAIDGVKRRTRASMGWCQGTFCRPRVAEVMEREYGHPVDTRFDIEHSGVNRVMKSELLDYLQSLER